MVTQHVPAQAPEPGVIDRNIKAMRFTFPGGPSGGSNYPPPGSGSTIINSSNGLTTLITAGWSSGQSNFGDTETQGLLDFPNLGLVATTIGNNGLDAVPADGFWNLYVLHNTDGNYYSYGSQSATPTFPAGTDLFARIGTFKMETGVIPGFDPVIPQITPFRLDIRGGRCFATYLNGREIICQDAPNDILAADANYHTININTDALSTNAPQVPDFAIEADLGLMDQAGGAGELKFRPSGASGDFLEILAGSTIRGSIPLTGMVSGNLDGSRGNAGDNSTFTIYGYTEMLGFVPVGGGWPVVGS